MNLKNVSAENIRTQTKDLATQELNLLTKMLNHLREIERRRLFSKWGFRSVDAPESEFPGWNSQGGF